MEVRVENKIAILLANDFPLVRSSITDLLNSSPNLEVVACAKATGEVLPLADVHHPRVGILDLDVEWPVLNDLVMKLAQRQTAALVINDAVDDDKTFELLAAGAMGIISPRANPELLCRSVLALSRGEIWVSRSATARLIEQLRMQCAHLAIPSQPQDKQLVSATETASPTPIPNYGLTRRELEIVRAIGDAMTNKDIAAQLRISEYTVKHHLTKIFDKVGVYSRLELAMMATHHGLVGIKVDAVA
jgi:DNA-binding NarL/FixJ family response regulator